MMVLAVKAGLHHYVLQCPATQARLVQSEFDVPHLMCVRAGDRFSCFANDRCKCLHAARQHAAYIEGKNGVRRTLTNDSVSNLQCSIFQGNSMCAS